MRAPLDDGNADHELDSAMEGGLPSANSAMRLWLVSGLHAAGVDPRRRSGAHGNVRRLLLADKAAGGGLQEMVSALQRQTLHSALAQLAELERKIVTLAYLEGRTNRQIASQVGVSVTTVKRRLWNALALLEKYIASSGAWLASMMLFGLAVLARWPKTARFFDPVAATVATGLVAVTVVGLAIVDSERPQLPRHAVHVTAPTVPSVADIKPMVLTTAAIPASQPTTAANVFSDAAEPAPRKLGPHRHHPGHHKPT